VTKVGEKLVGGYGHLFMGRMAPHEILQGIDAYLERVSPDRKDELMKAIDARAKDLAEGEKELGVDPASRGGVALSATVLAVYETLLPEFDGDEDRAIAYLQHVVGTVMRRTYEVMFEKLTSHDDPLGTIEKVCTKERPLYGSYFEMEFWRPDPKTFEMKVTRCLFHDFFVRHGAPRVNTVLCAWDANWMRGIDPAVSGLRAERNSLLSLGDDACRFDVTHTDDPVAEYRDVLKERAA